MNKRGTITCAALLSTTAFVAGCGSADGGSKSLVTVTQTVSAEGNSATAPANEEAPSSDTSSAPAEDATTEDSDSSSDSSSDQLLEFGNTHKANGYTVTVAQPTSATKGEYAAGGESFSKFAKVTVTIKNTSTGKTIDPSMVGLKVTTGGRESDQVYDGDKYGSGPSAKLLPGRSVTWTELWGYTPGETFSVEVDDYSSFDNAAAIFDGKVS